MTFDTVIHGGTVVTAEGQFQGDVGIAEGRPAGSRPMPISHRKARRA